MGGPNKIGKVDYIIYFKKAEFYIKTKEKLFDRAEIIYENEDGGIVKYNRGEENK